MTPGTYMVSADGGLWLRDGPGTNYPQILLMPDGSYVDTDSEGTEENGFGHVWFQNTEGWSSLKYLEGPAVVVTGEPAAETSPAGATAAEMGLGAAVNCEITGQDVALRAGPEISDPAFGAGSNVLVLTNRGEVVDCSANVSQNGFSYVVYKDKAGWMSDKYLAATDRELTGGAVAPATALEPVVPPAIKPEVRPAAMVPAAPTGAGLIILAVLATAGYFFLR